MAGADRGCLRCRHAMYGEHENAGQRRLVAGIATVALHVLMIGVLAWGLSFDDAAPQGPHEAAIVAIDLEPPTPPPPPDTVAAQAPKDRPAPQGIKGKAVPREAPHVALPFPMPPAAPLAGDGRDADAGAGAQGAGTGAGGSGTGGGGGGVGSPAQRIAGALRDSDYPREAERAGLAGTVVIGFRVRIDGRVDRCMIVRSSGYALLDDLTCRLFTQRYRFRPATTAAGDPVESTLQTSFTWGTRRR